jgi:hypothetical protein
MFGDDKTYFADSPVVITVSGLMWPASTPFAIVEVDVIYQGRIAGYFRVDTGRQSVMDFDISSALRAIWAGYDFSMEVAAANNKTAGSARPYRGYSLKVYTEYLSSDDGGTFVRTSSEEFTGGRCCLGGLTEWERANIGAKENADVSHWEHSNPRNGDASTKPRTTPERVGSTSITSWADVQNAGTTTHFYPANATPQSDGNSDHAPIVLRDSQEYTDFLFVNRRGAVETCSGQTLESLDITVETQQYARVERPTFKPSRTLMAIARGGRRSWAMSSGLQTREWAEWWTTEFLMARQWWMLYEGKYVPVIVEPSKKSIDIYDRAKQQMPHVDFTVTLALEG